MFNEAILHSNGVLVNSCHANSEKYRVKSHISFVLSFNEKAYSVIV